MRQPQPRLSIYHRFYTPSKDRLCYAPKKTKSYFVRSLIRAPVQKAGTLHQPTTKTTLESSAKSGPFSIMAACILHWKVPIMRNLCLL